MPGRGPGGKGRPGPRRGQRGMVTVELAIGVVTAVVVTACLVSLTLLGVAQSACAESSAQIARQAARGDEGALREAKERVPDGASIRIDRQPGGVSVSVALEVGVVGLGPVRVSAQAWAAFEPGVSP